MIGSVVIDPWHSVVGVSDTLGPAEMEGLTLGVRLGIRLGSAEMEGVTVGVRLGMRLGVRLGSTEIEGLRL